MPRATTKDPTKAAKKPAPGPVAHRRPSEAQLASSLTGQATPHHIAFRSDPARAARYGRGHELRDAVPREAHATFAPAANRPDPIAQLEEQGKSRITDLLPIRYGRMLASPFGFYRGAANVMASDLATTPRSHVDVQLAGDAHVSNFGFYASPERDLLFDVNDFDETLPGPFEWDVKRLAASVVVVGRTRGHAPATTREAVLNAVFIYRSVVRALAQLETLRVWYSRMDYMLLESYARGTVATMLEQVKDAAVHHDGISEIDRMVTTVDGKPALREQPPLMTHRPDLASLDSAVSQLTQYRRTLVSDRRTLLGRYHAVDVALKVVGVGSVGTRCFVALLDAADGTDPLLLQVKEAQFSVLSAHLPKSRLRTHGERVVTGQRIMQSESDIFLGWSRGPNGREFYWRQLRDMKGSFTLTDMSQQQLRAYAAGCAAALARAHARSGDPLVLAGYLGKSDVFDQAIATFAEKYADQAERDHAELATAVKSGRIGAETGI
jgi:uncharacterized protein (DUF2252 family)